MVRFTCVFHDLRHAARCTGLGALMGFKNPKAVAARGTKRIELADQDGVSVILSPDALAWTDDTYRDSSMDA
jgi:aldehyde:ferredoxin oxidoreductase